MRVAYCELRDQYVLDLNIPVERLHTRPRYADKDVPWNDRLGQVFRERVRVAFLDAGSPKLVDATLKLGVASPLKLGLLHVEKLISDALVDVGVLAGDHVGQVSRIEVYRRRFDFLSRRLGTEARDLQLVEVAAPGHEPIRREFYAIASERRPPTAAVDYMFDGIADNPSSYRSRLQDIAFDNEELGQLRLMTDLIKEFSQQRGLEAGGLFRLSIRISTTRIDLDLDNAGLFVLDLLAARLAELGVSVPLDQMVGRLHVTHEAGDEGFAARLTLLRHP